MNQLELTLDVSDAAGLGQPAAIAATVTLPDPDRMPNPPVVCFGKPGGGYSRGYYTESLPGPGIGAQAEWHARRGWVFVSVDHLGVGASSTDHDPTRLDYTTLAAAAQCAEEQVLARLREGSLRPDFPPILDPIRLGIGQSMGGCMTVVQQGRYHCYDGIGMLGFSAIHTHPPVRPGEAPLVTPWLPRDRLLQEPLTVLNVTQMEEIERRLVVDNEIQDQGLSMAWGFHYDDVDASLIEADLIGFPHRNGNLPPWGSATQPLAVALSCATPGAVAPEAAAVRSPVLIALGERDVCADPRGEPRAYLSAASVDLFVCPRMGHMHNFASTRQLLWQRIETWAAWVAAVKQAQQA